MILPRDVARPPALPRHRRLPGAGLLALGSLLLATPSAAAGGALEIFPDVRFVYLLLLFVVMIFPVNKLLFAPLLRVLDERRERIEGARGRAEQIAKEADSVLAQYETAVRGATEEAEADRRSRVEAARREQVEATGSVRADAETRITAARDDVARMLEEARGELRGQAEELAREAASRVLGRPLS